MTGLILAFKYMMITVIKKQNKIKKNSVSWFLFFQHVLLNFFGFRKSYSIPSSHSFLKPHQWLLCSQWSTEPSQNHQWPQFCKVHWPVLNTHHTWPIRTIWHSGSMSSLEKFSSFCLQNTPLLGFLSPSTILSISPFLNLFLSPLFFSIYIYSFSDVIKSSDLINIFVPGNNFLIAPDEEAWQNG